MTERDIFEHLLTIGGASRDPEGVVAACLTRHGQILCASASSDDGRSHAEFLVIQRARQRGLTIDDDCVLYTTLEPCSGASTVNDETDCVTCVIEAGVKAVVFAAADPEWSTDTAHRLAEAGVRCRRVEDQEIIDRATALFNSTIASPMSSLRLPRRKRLPAKP